MKMIVLHLFSPPTRSCGGEGLGVGGRCMPNRVALKT